MVPRPFYYPAVVTDADLAAAAESAARDSMLFAAEWAQLTDAERARYGPVTTHPTTSHPSDPTSVADTATPAGR